MNNDTFRCDLCGRTRPLAERKHVETATLAPYPEGADVCSTCAGQNDADWRELLQRKREIAEERGDYDFLRNH